MSDLPRPPLRELKSAVLWCARWLAPGGEFNRGRVRVRVKFASISESVEFGQDGDLTGLTMPPGLQLGPTGELRLSDVVGHFFGDGERAILGAIATGGPCKSGELVERLKNEVERTEVYALKKNLHARGLLGEDSNGRLFLSCDWVKLLLGDGFGQAA